MMTQLEKVKLDEIHTSFLPFFIETTKEELNHINQSLQKINQIYPILMISFQEKHYLVDGYKRAACFKKHKKSTIETKVIH